MELFAKIVNGWKPLGIFAKSSILDVWYPMLLTGIYYWDFSLGIYLFKVSTKTSDRGSLNDFFWLNLVEYKEVNACWLLTFLKKLWYCFRAPWSKARHFHAKTNKMGSTKWIYHKERNFAASFFIFLRTKFAYKNML